LRTSLGFGLEALKSMRKIDVFEIVMAYERGSWPAAPWSSRTIQ